MLRAVGLPLSAGPAGPVSQVRNAACGGGDHKQPHSAQALLALQVPCGAGDAAGGQIIPIHTAAAAPQCVLSPFSLLQPVEFASTYWTGCLMRLH